MVRPGKTGGRTNSLRSPHHLVGFDIGIANNSGKFKELEAMHIDHVPLTCSDIGRSRLGGQGSSPFDRTGDGALDGL
jgi:hypothetical protein